MWDNSIIHATIISGNEQSRTVGPVFNISWGKNNRMNEYCRLFTTPVTNENLEEMHAFFPFFFLLKWANKRKMYIKLAMGGGPIRFMLEKMIIMASFQRGRVQNNCSHLNEFKACGLKGCWKRGRGFMVEVITHSNRENGPCLRCYIPLNSNPTCRGSCATVGSKLQHCRWYLSRSIDLMDT